MVRASLAFSLLLASVPSCPDLYSIGTHGFSVPEVEASSASAVPDPGGVAVSVRFDARNDNPFPISFSGVDYRVTLQGTEVFAGTQTAFDVPDHGSTTQELKGVIDRTLPIYRTLTPGRSAVYSISGTAH